LTIKLTQHSSKRGPEEQGIRGSCKPTIHCISGCFGAFSRRTYAARRGKFAFPQNATLEQNLRFFAPCGLEFRITRCLLHSVVKEHPFAAICFRPERLRARRSAKPVWSRFREKNPLQTKNPATSAGRIRPFLWAAARCALRTDVLEARFLATRCS